MEEIKRKTLPTLECGMAYLAHPYASAFSDIKAFNLIDAGNIAFKIMRKYPNLTIISPLHAYSFFEGKELKETEILKYDFRLLNNCTLLILSGYWRHSRGCMAEYGYAKARGIRIYEYVDGTLYPLE